MSELLTMDELLDLADEMREATENVHGVDPRHFEEASRCLLRYASLKSWLRQLEARWDAYEERHDEYGHGWRDARESDLADLRKLLNAWAIPGPIPGPDESGTGT